MSGSKSNYPERPPLIKPKKPNKGSGKPSREHIHGRRKSWLSLRETVDGRGNDTGARSGQPWWRSPLMLSARMRKAELLRNTENQ